jgi:hypothetical protein
MEDQKTRVKSALLAMPNSGPHAAFFAAEFSSAFSRFLDSHALLHQ